MHVFLETTRLRLRRFTEADVENLVALDGDPAVMRYLTGGRPTPRAEVEQVILPRLLGYYERSADYGFWAAEGRTTGEFLGWFHFRPDEGRPDDEAELGYRLRRPAWGGGYATEGSRALIDRGFDAAGVRRVVATTMAVNAASRRVLEKAGLRHIRTFHQDFDEAIAGTEHGEVEYALTRAEWQRRRTSGGRPSGG